MKNAIRLLAPLLAAALFAAAAPPDRINYQGVLRDAAGAPVSGAKAMTFRLYDDPAAGTLLWEEIHDPVVYSPAITVTGGLFTVALGDPAHRNGGSEATFAGVTANHAAVYLAVRIETDPEMTPRIQVFSAPFAMNAGTLDGRDSAVYAELDQMETIAADWVNTANPWTDAEVSNVLTLGAGSTIDASIPVGNANTVDGFSAAATATANTLLALNASGQLPASADMLDSFHEASFFKLGDNESVTGIPAFNGGSSGLSAPFSVDSTFLVTSLNADLLDGQHASAFMTSATDNWVNTTGDTMTGKLTTAASAAGGAGLTLPHGAAPTTPVNGDLWTTTTGLYGRVNGATVGFLDTSSTAQTKTGPVTVNTDGTGTGINSYGADSGGYFADALATPTGEAFVGDRNYGIRAFGSQAGAFFSPMGSNTRVYLGESATGVRAYGPSTGGTGGHFASAYVSPTGYADVGEPNYGIRGWGDTAGGYFKDANATGYGYVGRVDTGGEFYGNGAGVYASDLDTIVYGRLGFGTSSTEGNGTKNFVQNHPFAKDRVIVYSSLEGDEAGTYTRGTGRLQSGAARVELGETFRWVTNPDLGLTVHLTPAGEWADLFVAEKATDHIVVRSRDASSDAAFDYIVFGLRIGFEEIPVIRSKDVESLIPSMAEHRAAMAADPGLKAYTALERYKAMESGAGLRTAIDLSASHALRDAIGEYDPAIHGPVKEFNDGGQEAPAPDAPPAAPAVHPEVAVERRPADAAAMDSPDHPVPSTQPAILPIRFPVSSPVVAGEVLVMDLGREGMLSPCIMESDAMVVGVAQEPGEAEAQVASTGIVRVNADASYAPIRRGDLLATSPTPGRAMKAVAPLPGAILGKALESLDGGTGSILVLLQAR